MPCNWVVTYEKDAQAEQIDVYRTFDQVIDALDALVDDDEIMKTLAVHIELVTEDGSHAIFALPEEVDLLHEYVSINESDIFGQLAEINPIFGMMWKSETYFN